MTRAEWITFGTVEALLGLACIRRLALVRLAPKRPPIVALQLRTGALRRVDALHALGSIEQKGLATPLKREGITRT